MDMQTMTVNISGVSPLLQNSPKAMAGGHEVKVGKKVIPTPEVEAESKSYRTTDGRLYIPAIGFRSGLLRAGTGERIGKRAAKAVLSASVFVLEEEAILVNPDTGEFITEYEIDARRAVIQRQGIIRHRPRIDSWATTVSLEVDVELLGSNADEVLAHYFAVAGTVAGVGDYRPERGGWFGRYVAEVVSAS